MFLFFPVFLCYFPLIFCQFYSLYFLFWPLEFPIRLFIRKILHFIPTIAEYIRGLLDSILFPCLIQLCALLISQILVLHSFWDVSLESFQFRLKQCGNQNLLRFFWLFWLLFCLSKTRSQLSTFSGTFIFAIMKLFH